MNEIIRLPTSPPWVGADDKGCPLVDYGSVRGGCMRIAAEAYGLGAVPPALFTVRQVCRWYESGSWAGQDVLTRSVASMPVRGGVVTARFVVYGHDDLRNHVEVVTDRALPLSAFEDVVENWASGREMFIPVQWFFKSRMPWSEVIFYAGSAKKVSCSDVSSDESAVRAMRKYHEYLETNYTGGVQRFFSPVGFLRDFQSTVELATKRKRDAVYAGKIDDAVSALQPIINGQEGIFDIVAEPGTGKTSVLPFKFPSKRVVVAMPTPFDAWSAFTSATANCRLHIKGLRLGDSEATVCYTDSYMAADAIMSGHIEYDVMIVDECNSGKGVTAFLAEVRPPGKALIRMSGSSGKIADGTKGFSVVEDSSMPDIRTGLKEVAKYVLDHQQGRTLVLTPDAQTARELASSIPAARLLTSDTPLPDLARAMLNQRDDCIYVADDVCARGVNLNLDTVFDTQLVAEHGSVRVVTPEEDYQRKRRVGRNKSGRYHSAGLRPIDKGHNDVDVFRNNVVRAAARVEQVGPKHVQVPVSDCKQLLRAEREPYLIKESCAITSASSSPEPMESVTTSGSDSGKYRTPSRARHSSDSDSGGSVTPPAWLAYFSGATTDHKGSSNIAKYRIKPGGAALVRRRSSRGGPVPGFSSGLDRLDVSEWTTSSLPQVEGAQYAAPARVDRRGVSQAPAVPMSPPIMDLSSATYAIDWPALIRDRLVSGGELPSLAPPAGWRHTAAGGMATNWLMRLDNLSLEDQVFSEQELELVCRAWNRLVAMEWVKRTPGLTNEANRPRLEFCARYFQAYYQLAGIS